MRRVFKYRIYPTARQAEALGATLDLCRELYNAALQERRDAWRINRISVGLFSQCKQLTEIKVIRPELKDVHWSPLEDALKRVDKAFKAFFRRAQRGARAGFPRFRSFRRYDSFTLRRTGNVLVGNRVRIPKIGPVRIKLHRPLKGTVKETHIKRECGRWYACFVVECRPEPLPTSAEPVGIDVGIATFATLSDGTGIDNPRYFESAQRRLRVAQRRVARRQKGSHRRRKAVALLQRIHTHVRNQRADFQHKISRWLVDNYGLIAVEDLNVRGLAAGMLAKQVNDAAWSSFIFKLFYKAESAGRTVVKVDARGSSQTCLCGAEVRKTLAQRWHDCESCGLSLPRDHVSAQVILQRALAVGVQAVTCPTAESVA